MSKPLVTPLDLGASNPYTESDGLGLTSAFALDIGQQYSVTPAQGQNSVIDTMARNQDVREAVFNYTLSEHRTPEDTAMLVKELEKRKLPTDVADIYEPDFKESKLKRELEEVWQQAPTLMSMLRDPVKFNLVKGDTAPLMSFEGAMRTLAYKVSPDPRNEADGFFSEAHNAVGRALFGLASVGPWGSASEFEDATRTLKELADTEQALKTKPLAEVFYDPKVPLDEQRDPQQAYKEFKDTLESKRQEAMDKALKAYDDIAWMNTYKGLWRTSDKANEFGQTEGFWGATKWIVSNPGTFVASTGVESLVTMLPTLTAAGVTAAITGGAGAPASASMLLQALVMGAGSYQTDKASQFLEKLDGIVGDDADAKAKLQDYKNLLTIEQASDEATKHAQMVGMFDALSFGVAGKYSAVAKTMRGTAEAGKVARAVKMTGAAATDLSVQGALGGAGEATGQLYATGEVNWRDVAAEFFGEFVTAPLEIATANAGAHRDAQALVRMKEAQTQQLAKAISDIQATTTAKVSPETVGKIAEDALGGDTFILDTSKLDQGVLERIVSEIPAVQGAMEENEELGVGVRVSAKDFGEFLARNPDVNAETLAQAVTVDGMTVDDAVAESEAIHDAGEEALAKEYEDRLSKVSNKEHAEGLMSIHKSIQEDLASMGNVTTQEARAVRSIVTNLYGTLAQEAGMDVKELWAKHGVRYSDGTNAKEGDGLKQEKRGEFNPISRLIVKWAKGDNSTLAHESAHAYLEARMSVVGDLGKLDARSESQQGLVEEGEALAKWLGYDSVEAFNNASLEDKRQAHEKFASTFEAYLMEGHAPTPGLRAVFKKYKEWLVAIYKSIMNIKDANLTDEAFDLIENLFLTDKAIKRKKLETEVTGLTGLIRKAIREFNNGEMTDQELVQELVDMNVEYLDEAEAHLHKAMNSLRNRQYLQRRALRELMAGEDISELGLTAQEREKVEGAIGAGRKAYEASKGKEAVEKMRNAPDTLPTVAQVRAMKFEPNSIYSAEDVELLRKFKLYRTRGKMRSLTDAEVNALQDAGLLRAEGEPANLTLSSQALGYENEQALVADIFKYRTEDDAVTTLALDWLGDVHAQERAKLPSLKVNEAILNKTRLRVMRALHDLARNKDASFSGALSAQEGKAIEAVAVAVVRATPFKQQNLTKLRNLSNLALKEFNTALDKGDLKRAVQCARHLLFTTAMAIEARRVREELSARTKWYKKLARKDIPAVDNRVGTIIKEVLLRAGLMSTTRMKENRIEGNISARINRIEGETGTLANISPDFLALVDMMDDKRVPKELSFDSPNTADNFHAVMSALYEWGVRADEKTEREYKRAIESMARELSDGVKGKAEKDGKDPQVRRPERTKLANWLRRYYYGHLRPRTVLLRMFDTKADAVYEHILEPLQNCHNKYDRLNKDIAISLDKAVQPVKKTVYDVKRRWWNNCPLEFSRAEIFGMLLNIGNEGNKARLVSSIEVMLNRKWEADALSNPEKLVEVRDEYLQGQHPHVYINALIDSLISQALTKEDVEAANNIWAIFNVLQEESREAMYAIVGREAKWVKPEALMFKLADGSVVKAEGGYYPIVYGKESREYAKAGDKIVDEESGQIDMLSANGKRSDVFHGHLESRADAPPSGRVLDLLPAKSLFRGLERQIYYASYASWVFDMNALMTNTEFAEVVRNYWGDDSVESLRNWVADVAKAGRHETTVVDDTATFLRKGISIGMMGFNVVTAMVQLTGVFPAVASLGAVNVLNGLGQFLSHGFGLGALKDIQSKSDMMKYRMNTQFRELTEVRSRTESKVSSAINAVGRVAYLPIVFVQGIIDCITWYAGYNKAISEGYEGKDAIARADSAVTVTQGTGKNSELSAIERGGPVAQLFTVFYNFFNAAFNVLALTAHRDSTLRLMQAIFWMSLVQPIAETMLREAIAEAAGSGGDDKEYDSEWEEWLHKYVPNMLGFNMGYFVYFRELAGLTELLGERGTAGQYAGPLGLDKIKRTQQIVSTVAKKDLSDYDERDYARFVAFIAEMTGTPLKPVERYLTGKYGVEHGYTDSWLAYIFGWHK